MPYINKQMRELFESEVSGLGQMISTPGELNYVISRLLVHLLADEAVYGFVDYEVLSAYNAAIKDAAVEFERRVLAPYEDKKRFENGDVYRELLGALGLGSVCRLTDAAPAEVRGVGLYDGPPMEKL